MNQELMGANSLIKHKAIKIPSQMQGWKKGKKKDELDVHIIKMNCVIIHIWNKNSEI